MNNNIIEKNTHVIQLITKGYDYSCTETISYSESKKVPDDFILSLKDLVKDLEDHNNNIL